MVPVFRNGRLAQSIFVKYEDERWYSDSDLAELAFSLANSPPFNGEQPADISLTKIPRAEQLVPHASEVIPKIPRHLRKPRTSEVYPGLTVWVEEVT